MVNGKENMKCRIFHVFPRESKVSDCVKRERPRNASSKSAKTKIASTNVGTSARAATSRIVSRKTVIQKHSEDGCEVCGKQDNCDALMECDGCASRYCHTFCLGFTTLPGGDWFCSKFLSDTV
jgi:hypothetical protein